MTVEELIKELEKVKDKSKEINIQFYFYPCDMKFMPFGVAEYPSNATIKVEPAEMEE